MPTFSNPRPGPFATSAPDVASQEVRSRLLQAQFGDGYRHALEDGVHAHPVAWSLSFSALEEAQATRLRLEAQWAHTGLVTYTVPGDTPRTYRVEPGSLKSEQTGTGLTTINFTLVEEFGALPDDGQTIAEVIGL